MNNILVTKINGDTTEHKSLYINNELGILIASHEQAHIIEEFDKVIIKFIRNNENDEFENL